MALNLKVMVWNIAEGSFDRQLPYHGALPRIADQIRAMSPDIVLLNEVHNRTGPLGDGMNQVKDLAARTDLPHYHWGNTTKTGMTGFKAVAVLSRFPVEAPRVHHVMRGSQRTTYAMLETTVRVGGVALQAISLRFDKGNLTNNEAGHRQLVDLINRMNPKVPVVVGGDFNADPNTDHMKDFVARSGLTDVFSKRPDPGICGSADTRIDYIFYRGFDDVVRMEQRCPWETGTEASDHAWVYAEVVGEPPNQEPHILREGGTFYTGDSSRLCLPLPTHV